MKHGFTLIELMVVIGIVVLLTVGSVYGISNSRSGRQVKTTAEKLKSFLMEARSMAMNPSDTSFGVICIRTKIYPFNSANSKKNLVEVIEVKNFCNGSNDQEGNILATLTMSKGANIDSDHKPPYGNMNCGSGGVKAPCGNNIDYYYFSFNASDSNSMGQISDVIPLHFNVYMNIGDNSWSNNQNLEHYKLEVDAFTGLIKVDYIQP